MFSKRSLIVTAVSLGMLVGSPLLADDASNAAAQNNQAQSAQSGQQADQQLIQQINEIQQNPKEACDKLFLLNTAISSMCEVQFSQLVADKAQNSQVKEAAQKIADDHKQMNEQLQQAAKQLGVQLPHALPALKQAELQVLGSLPAQQLEQAYISDMAAEHAKDVSKFQSVAQNSQSADVKQFAAQALPKLQQHQQWIQQSATALGINLQGPEAIPAGQRIGGSSANDTGNNGVTKGSPGENNANNGTNGTNGNATGNQNK